MSFFNNVKIMKESLSKTANNIAANMAATNMENEKIKIIENEIDTLNSEINAAYTQVGRKYIDYVIENKEMPGIDISDILSMLDPKMIRKSELDKELIEIHKRLKDQMIIQEKNKLEEKYLQEKEKLDKALAMNIINEEEYNYKLNVYKKKIDNFDQIKKIEQQYELEIISKEEMNSKIDAIMKDLDLE